MARVYDIVEKIANGSQKPTIRIDADHEFKINNSFPAAIAIKAYGEDKTLDDMQKIKKILGTALDKEANKYIESLELGVSTYGDIVNVIMAAIGDISLEEMEELAERQKKNPSK